MKTQTKNRMKEWYDERAQSRIKYNPIKYNSIDDAVAEPETKILKTENGIAVQNKTGKNRYEGKSTYDLIQDNIQKDDEIVRLKAENEQYKKQEEQYKKQLGQERKDKENYKKEASIDDLTGLGNKRKFERETLEQIEMFRRESVRFGIQENKSLSLLMMDIDHFKDYNDTYGHGTADKMLKRVATLLQEHSRAGARVYRWGGEEIAIVMAHTDELDAYIASERYRRLVEDESADPEKGLPGVKVSIGLANYTKHVADPYTIKDRIPNHEKSLGDIKEELVDKADAALYAAKCYRNMAAMYNPEVDYKQAKENVLAKKQEHKNQYLEAA